MKQIDNLFERLITQKQELQEASIASLANSRTNLKVGVTALPSGPQQEFILQEQIRPLFGKPGINENQIGTHPDFIHLESAQAHPVFQYACTMFIDIKGSTRLNLLYKPENVYRFKNVVLQTCIETVRALDGHVHRLMGDAVLAFFGGSQIDKEDSVADALNCAMTLRSLVDHSIKPWMMRNGFETEYFGIRIGIDFGDDQDVLWAGYGYSSVGEVTATGLTVDMASKLQSQAGINEIMLGQSLLEFVDWPDPYSVIKTGMKNGETTNFPIVTPNLTKGDGTQLNYKMRLLQYESAAKFSPLPIDFRSRTCSNNVVSSKAFNLKCYASRNETELQYISASRFLDKHVSLKFQLAINTRIHNINFPLKAIFTKTNYGKEATANENLGIFSKTYTINMKKKPGYRSGFEPFVFQNHHESTLYRGLHTMECKVKDAKGNVLFRDWIGAFIK